LWTEIHRRGNPDFFDVKKCTVCDERFGSRLDPRLKILEIDGSHGLLDMQRPRLSVQSHTIPIENPIGRIAILLDLDDHVAFADSVKPPTRDKNTLPGCHRYLMKGRFHIPAFKKCLKLLSSHPTFETRIDRKSVV
jgi:hypothetical protein